MKKVYVILMVLALAGCSKTKVNVESPVPEYRVNYSINYLINAPLLDTQGGYYEITEPTEYGQYLGYSGLVIFHGFDDRFYAYDLCCPNCCKQHIRVKSSMAGVATCDSCGTEYDIGFGSGAPTKGETTKIMRRYTVSCSGTVIRVTN